MAYSDDHCPHARLCIFSGGTAFNSASQFLARLTPKVSYVLPVSDDGGSTAEVLRILGGPAIGDIRSRLLRLAVPKNMSTEAAVKLLKYRLPKDEAAAADQWKEVIAGTDPLWHGVTADFRGIILGFLRHFDSRIQAATKPDDPSSHFRFQGGNLGNFFFSGARMFCGKLQAAVTLWKLISTIPNLTEVCPIVECEESLILAAELDDDTLIVGQNKISHPPHTDAPESTSGTVDKSLAGKRGFAGGAKIRRMMYLRSDNTEYTPQLSASALEALQSASTVVYAMGSLFTSIIPTLIVPGVADAIASKRGPKVLLLNGTYDRETLGFKASDVIMAVVNALDRHAKTKRPPTAYVTVLIVPKSCQIELDHAAIEAMGIRIDAVSARLKPFTAATTRGSPPSRSSQRRAEDDNDDVSFDEHALAKKLFEIANTRPGLHPGEAGFRSPAKTYMDLYL